MSVAVHRTRRDLRDALWLVAFCGIALVLHIFAGFTFYCANALWSWSSRPLINPDNVMEVSMVVLPKSPTQMVQRNTRVKVSQGTSTAKQKVDVPPRQSDLALKTPDAPKNQGQPDRSEQMKRLVDMASVLSTLDGPVANENSTASDPDSTLDEAINVGHSGLRADPELARYVQKIRDLFHKNFSPLPTIVAANPDIECTIHVRFEMNTGRITNVTTRRSSGNASYDGAALRAVEAVSSVPLPPERFKSQFADGYLMVFP